ncbi:MAG TPA: hypothetical protein ENK21_03550 [Trueperaceae bacterium]|nr:hypothetical protein [Trueperaceae bacterium]
MANEIYNLAHGGLSDMVSARAATNILNKALKSEGYSKTSLNHAQVKEVLQGYVFEELRNILPSRGVKRQIKNILQNIADELPEPVVQNEVKQPVINLEQAAEPQKLVPVSQAVVAVADKPTSYVNEVKVAFDVPDEPAQEPEDTDFDSLFAYDQPEEIELEAEESLEANSVAKKYDDISDDLFEAVSNQTAIVDEEELEDLPEAKPKAKIAKKNPIHRKQIKESVDFSSIKIADLENLVQNFSLIEEARAIAIVSTSGKLIDSRGKGFDLDKLASLSNMALMLLKKSGKIRSYHLSVDSSQLFLFPVDKHFVVVIGSQEINFGEVISIFANFEEAV